MKPIILAVVAGLFAEQSTEVDGVRIRRIRDTSNNVVCYVASAKRLGYNVETVAIDCLQDRSH